MSLQYDNELDAPRFAISRKKVKLFVFHDNKEFYEMLCEEGELISHKFDLECQYSNDLDKAYKIKQEWQPSAIILDLNAKSYDILTLVQRWKDGISDIFVVGNYYSEELDNIMRSYGAKSYFWKDEHNGDIGLILERIAHVASEINDIH
jgi:DNA-binding response OmpR family regulator